MVHINKVGKKETTTWTWHWRTTFAEKTPRWGCNGRVASTSSKT